MSEQTKEQEILMVMRKVLTSVIKDVTPPPGMKHPLTENTVQDVRACLGLISARERELADGQGRVVEKPFFTDEKPAARVVPISKIKRSEKPE